MNVKCTVAILALALAGAVSAEAGVNQRQKSQKARIALGVASGKLTLRETKKLVAEQARIQKLETRLRADGTLNTKDRARLARAQAKAKLHIKKQKNDRQTRH